MLPPQDRNPIGTILPWYKGFRGNTVLPDGYVECNGQTLVDGTASVVIPDLNNNNGRFLRGGTVAGNFQDDEVRSHNHGGATGGSCPRVQSSGGQVAQRVQMHLAPPGPVDTQRLAFAPHCHGVHEDVVAENHTHSIPSFGGDETRPKNMSVVYIIRYK
eukprot:gnl/Spiro4/23884_TR11825_c0_g1_i1.p1 gnl/Spiro4/23884_TR11825_c0_g1~~gnl/Spiro4/23884_TR11825_c0_g1_i1.p1  ORF type:complete len:159 (+),score=11.84 gnl/Spiro4/23884_TR11825_c0_g1_i1:169-645(+)